MPKRPNILFLMLDQQAASALSIYGGATARTPNIQSLADRGVVFDNAYTNFPVCAPSRASMMSGQLASRIACYDNAAEFCASVPTLAHYLRFLGYQTTLCGKMHFIGPDLLHGFEERLTPEIYSADFRTLPQWDGVDDDFATDAREALFRAGPVPRTVQMDYDEEVEFHARRKLYDLARSDDSRNFFLAVSFTHPHEPFLCRQEHWNRYSNDEIELPVVSAPEALDLDEHSRRIYRHYNLPAPGITDQHIRNARRAYYGSMSYVDDMIGRILKVLDETGLADDTVIFLTSDHGDMLGERGLWFKKVFFENSVRVPLLLCGPGFEPRRVGENVSLIDLLPTLVDIADPAGSFEPVRPFAGNSVIPLAAGSVGDWPDTVYSEMTCEGVIEPVMMVKRGAYKYIYSASAPPLLFDLNNDPHERENLSGQDQSATCEGELRALADCMWGDLTALRATIVTSQKTRLFVREALEMGTVNSWDDNPHTSTGGRYLRRGRSYNTWNYAGVDRLRGRHRPR
ncbi:MAG: choline-sulfatase [Paracoccaceae bacterium]|nr:choline-sulfatase [Paracoccaceae bacterium]